MNNACYLPVFKIILLKGQLGYGSEINAVDWNNI